MRRIQNEYVCIRIGKCLLLAKISSFEELA